MATKIKRRIEVSNFGPISPSMFLYTLTYTSVYGPYFGLYFDIFFITSNVYFTIYALAFLSNL